jgi:hypothetical protein
LGHVERQQAFAQNRCCSASDGLVGMVVAVAASGGQGDKQFAWPAPFGVDRTGSNANIVPAMDAARRQDFAQTDAACAAGGLKHFLRPPCLWERSCGLAISGFLWVACNIMLLRPTPLAVL